MVIGAGLYPVHPVWLGISEPGLNGGRIVTAAVGILVTAGEVDEILKR